LKDAIPVGEWTLIRESLQRGQLTGSGKFIDEIEKIAGIRVEHRGRGRPRKPADQDA
jgi:putative transposase